MLFRSAGPPRRMSLRRLSPLGRTGLLCAWPFACGAECAVARERHRLLGLSLRGFRAAGITRPLLAALRLRSACCAPLAVSRALLSSMLASASMLAPAAASTSCAPLSTLSAAPGLLGTSAEHMCSANWLRRRARPYAVARWPHCAATVSVPLPIVGCARCFSIPSKSLLAVELGALWEAPTTRPAESARPPARATIARCGFSILNRDARRITA